ncbi:hypothetical protein OB69_17110 [Roseivirga seohaensis subsp. aquiponti]|uniref:Antitoxin n=1 Tax=Roseivirga seohaensis subsp. aquiponti TaxID=1566026 RepID=A0A0L8AH31_9BACT|nr:DUF6364 family protein [Roseivirga seohaensis]KOF01581.1 hypothetical protein OB69_17110 [Roseivirga seohaensis subsp. aquiponti]
MKTNLTLTLNKEVIEQAKKYAANKGESLSEMVENYFKYIIHSKAEYEEGQLTPRVKKLRAVLKVDSDFNYKDVLNEAKSTKHGL